MKEPVSELICFVLFFIISERNEKNRSGAERGERRYGQNWNSIIFNVYAILSFWRHRNAQKHASHHRTEMKCRDKIEIIFVYDFRALMENVFTFHINCDWLQHQMERHIARQPKYEFQIRKSGRLNTSGGVWDGARPEFKWVRSHVTTLNMVSAHRTPSCIDVTKAEPFTLRPKSSGARRVNKSPTKIHFHSHFPHLAFFPFHFISFRFVVGDHLKRWSIACLSVFSSGSGFIFRPMSCNAHIHSFSHTHVPIHALTHSPFQSHFHSHSFSFIVFFSSFSSSVHSHPLSLHSLWRLTFLCPNRMAHTHIHIRPHKLSENISVWCVLSQRWQSAHNAELIVRFHDKLHGKVN